MTESILIVDSDESVLSILNKAIQSAGMESKTVSRGEEALELVRKQSFDLILLDVNLQGMDGFQVIRSLRGAGYRIPIMIVSSRKENYDTLYGLDIGADDYISKPFNPVILAAKAKALIRRSRGGLGGNVITAGPFRYHTSTLRFYKNGQEIILTSRENAMMKMFLDNVNRVFSKEMLYELIWGEAIVDENAIMVYINRLRQKIEENPAHPKFIQTVRGLGYRFVV